MAFVLVGVLITLSVGVLLVGLGQLFRPGDEGERRIEKWIREIEREGPKPGQDLARGRVAAQVDRALARRGLAQSLAVDLARADLTITVSEYLALHAGVVVASFLIGFLLHRNLITGLLLALIGAILPQVYIRSRQGRRLHTFNRQLPDVLERLVGSLRAGYGLLQAVEWVAKQMPAPAGTEFDRVIRETQLGRSLAQALDSMVRRLDSDDLALIVTAIQIHHEVGGSLADILETVADTIRERVRIQRDIRVLTAQQRFSGYILILLPIALALFLYIVNPEYEAELFRPGPTLCIPIGAAIMMVLGYIAMQRIVRIDV